MENKSKTLKYLSIPHSSFYYHRILDQKDLILKEKIEKTLEKNPSYGHRRIALALEMNKKPVKRVISKNTISDQDETAKNQENQRIEANLRLLLILIYLYPCSHCAKAMPGLQISLI